MSTNKQIQQQTFTTDEIDAYLKSKAMEAGRTESRDICAYGLGVAEAMLAAILSGDEIALEVYRRKVKACSAEPR